VGARAATRSARSLARRLGRDLAARGLTIVSGLARGIDAEAHRGALEVGGRTVGVLAGGLDRIYPPEHRELVEEMVLDGAVLSEVPLGTAPRRELFPLRNRIISGLSLGIIVVEARRRSGSLITVRHALNQGREVWVVPGSSEGPFAEGSNYLLREGARAIRGARDVIEDLGGALSCKANLDSAGSGAPLTDRRSPLEPLRGDPLEERILETLREGPATREDLCCRVELDSGRLAQALLCLELADRIIEERDGRFHLCFA
jgi:DNA processing protein